MNTRLQVEHPVTELVMGIDLVEKQIEIADGKKLELEQSAIKPCGHAIEARIYAEDPFQGFIPTPGPVVKCEWPIEIPPLCKGRLGGVGQSTSPDPSLQRRGVARIDTGIRSGDTISPKYDPMVAKVSAIGENRNDATKNLIQGLTDTTLLGFTHNIEFLKGVLRSEQFKQSAIKTNTIETDYVHEVDHLVDEKLLQQLVSELFRWPKKVSEEDNEPVNLFGVIQFEARS